MVWDAVVVGSGIGGLSAAAVLAKAGKQVLVLEANYLPGGCCSSYWRKGYIFEAGATTLMGFDAGQPLALLGEILGPELLQNLNKQALDPAMTVWQDGKRLLRYRDFDQWLTECILAFGEGGKWDTGLQTFWKQAMDLSNFVWRASGKNLRFPPTGPGDLVQLALANSPVDYPKLRFAFTSTIAVLRACGLGAHSRFHCFLNEQLIITAQSDIARTPFLFAAAALCYTNYSNYNLPGGMIRLAEALLLQLARHGGSLLLRRRVTQIEAPRGANIYYRVTDHTGEVHQARQVLSNIPIWNLPDVTEGRLKARFQQEANKLTDYWGAYTMGIVVKDTFADDLTLHHQLILPVGETIPYCGSHSVFVSFSGRDDRLRSPEGTRVLAISTHAKHPAEWFNLAPEDYAQQKEAVKAAILQVLTTLPGFSEQNLFYSTESSPLSWQKWVLRKHGTVGGLPQTLKRPIFTWLGAKTSAQGFYRCGDTVYPGQGVPGVVLGGIIAARRMLGGK